MFRSWKCGVNDPLGMFEEWGLDRMLHRHRTRMATMIKEGKPPDERMAILIKGGSANPYIEEECGDSTKKEDEEKQHDSSVDSPLIDDADNGGNANEDNDNMDTQTARIKLYFQWIEENTEWIELNQRREQRSEEDLGIFAEWRDMVPKVSGMFVEWRDNGNQLKNGTDPNQMKVRMSSGFSKIRPKVKMVASKLFSIVTVYNTMISNEVEFCNSYASLNKCNQP